MLCTSILVGWSGDRLETGLCVCSLTYVLLALPPTFRVYKTCTTVPS